MITEQQQELAIRCAFGELTEAEKADFSAQVRASPEIREFLRSLQSSLDSMARSAPQVSPPAELKSRVMARIGHQAAPGPSVTPAGLRFVGAEESGWKALPLPGAFIKLLSLQSDRGYAVLLGKLEPGTRYPAHANAGPEDFYILTGDLHVSGRRLGPGDFHHAEAGSQHEENYSVNGCTLLAVLTTDDPLVTFAMT